MKKTALQKNIFTTYLLFIGICIGAEIAVGALVASVIFFPGAYLGDGVLSHFQSGILMTQIFLRFNILLIVCTFFIAVYEVYSYFIKNHDFISVVILFVVLAGVLAFVLYFTPYILEAQKMGAQATSTKEFKDIHSFSELVIKIVLIGQIALFFRRVLIELK
ncbi:MAG: DUF4149 domain-containing protein [Campylobacteraceae bacterium]|jgi:hypothetical protein|nr:DUF4149 domain-containing protein [Campylobacteraceae bacterium]